MRLPLGLRMVTGLLVGRLFRTGALMVPKLAVLPVLAMVRWLKDSVVGGPRAIVKGGDTTNKQVGMSDE
jgi:hypothetical protein